MKPSFLLVCCAAVALSFSSCKKDEPDDPIIPNEEEVITTLNFELTPQGGGSPITLTFQDLDGDGGNDPIISDAVLATNTVYSGKLELLNEIANPTENITDEVAEEAVEHQFFFQTTVDGLTMAYADQDANGNPIGIETTVTTGAAGSGTITVILKHEPNKTATGVADGNVANAGGETDIEVTFSVDVE